MPGGSIRTPTGPAKAPSAGRDLDATGTHPFLHEVDQRPVFRHMVGGQCHEFTLSQHVQAGCHRPAAGVWGLRTYVGTV